MGKGLDFYNEQLGYMARGDIAGLLRDHYHEDAELVTFEFTLKGIDAIYTYLTEDSPAKMGKALGMETTHFAESDDVVIFNAKVNSEKMGLFVARDVFYFKDAKVYRHIALTLPPDSDRALWESEI